jgi:hypothetical protein
MTPPVELTVALSRLIAVPAALLLYAAAAWAAVVVRRVRRRRHVRSPDATA